MRRYKPTDYETLVGWWNKWEFPPPPQFILPKVGLIIEGLAAGFMYLTDSPVGWMEWVVCNPEANKEERSKALNMVINELCIYGKENGCPVSFTTTNDESYKQRLIKLGYIVGDTDTTQLMRTI